MKLGIKLILYLIGRTNISNKMYHYVNKKYEPTTPKDSIILTLTLILTSISSFNIRFQHMKLGIHLILYLIGRTNKFNKLGPIIEEVVTCRQFLLAFHFFP